MASETEVQARCVLSHLPVLVLRAHVMFPGTRQTVYVQESAFNRLWQILRQRRTKGDLTQSVGVISLRQGGQEVYNVGTLCHLVSHSGGAAGAGVRKGSRKKSSAASVRLMLEGVGRFAVLRVARASSCPRLMDVRLIAGPEDAPTGVGLMVVAHRVQEKLVWLASQGLSKGRCWRPVSAGGVADMVGAAVVLLTLEERQSLLEISDPHKRLRMAEGLLDASDRRRKEAPPGTLVVRWPAPALQAPKMGRLPANSTDETEGGLMLQLALRLSRAGLPAHAKSVAQRELKRLKILRPDHPEYFGMQKYLETMASLPWQTVTPDSVDLDTVRVVLDRGQHGHHKAKQRILEFLAVQKMRGSMCAAPVLCVAGPPGVGKTSLARSVAESLRRKFQHIALGGVRDEAELRGHRRTYIGSMPGIVMQAVQTAGTRNPVLLLDEIDKLGKDHSFNPQAVLLEVLDPEQNASFKDHYLNTAFDLSSVLFICTANDTSLIDRPLLDRMELIQLSGYTVDEKIAIAEEHLLPKQRRLHGLQSDPAFFEGSFASNSVEFAPLVCLMASAVESQRRAQNHLPDMAVSPPPPPPMLMLTRAAVVALVTRWTSECGVRSLERCLAQICRWAVMLLQGFRSEATSATDVPPVHDGDWPLLIDECHLAAILGEGKYDAELAQSSQVGVAVTLAPTTAGGYEPRVVEAVRFAALRAGSSCVQVTGVRECGTGASATRESVLTAASTLRHLADEAQVGSLPLTGAFESMSAMRRAGEPFRGEDVHLNFASSGVFGSAFVDDSSVGLAALLALASLHMQQAIRVGLAVLGEVTLRGQLLVPDSAHSMRDAVLAAQQAGFTCILLPEGCRRHVVHEVEASALRDLDIRYVRRVEEALEMVFGPTEPNESILSAEISLAREEWAERVSQACHAAECCPKSPRAPVMAPASRL